ncbi:TATA element modulatory factor 1 TATA binding-domain-containing protein [Xylariaceae sp. FL0804]|nr:TATA element modulatory factor 1 TATA binding-domain-containing protein [Xylariaceae sp. FL0804]
MAAPQKSSKWGSFLSQAVAGVEARLDNILAEEDGTKPQVANAPASASEPPPTVPPQRSSTPSKSANDRLQERLARAVAARNAAQRSDAPSPRQSTEITSSPRPSSEGLGVKDAHQPQPPVLSSTEGNSLADEGVSPAPTSGQGDQEEPPPILPTQGPASVANGRIFDTGSPRSSTHSERPAMADVLPVVAPSLTPDTDTTSWPQTTTEADASSSELYEERIAALSKMLEESQTQHQEELHSHVERVDALQAKLQYLAREASQSARTAATTAPAGTMEKKLAEKDEKIAQLMDEGQKLAATEQKHRSIIKKLRSQLATGERDMNEQKIWRQKTENQLNSLRRRVAEYSELEKAHDAAQNVGSQLRRDLESLRSELAGRDNTIAELKLQMQEESDQAKSNAAELNDELREAGRQRVHELEEAVAALEVEKSLVADRAKAQAAELQSKADTASQHARAVELELKGEVQILESKLEALRARAEEASSGATGDAQAKLLRQIETLQTQYSVASENWQGIEASLVARAASLEKERDEALRRESEIRRKARETATRAKRQEEELEETRSQLPDVRRDLTSYQSQLETTKKRAEEAEAALTDVKADLQKHQAAWKEEKPDRVEQDRRNWLDDVPATALRNYSRPESPLLSAVQRTFSGDNFLGLQNHPARFRKPSAPSSNGDPTSNDRPSSARRPSFQPPIRSPSFPTLFNPSGTPPPMHSGPEGLASPPTHAVDRDDVFGGMERSASPQNVVHDMVSVSTTTAGPSVQLVERMSAAIRRLESEKVGAKEELARISSQRDEARGEIVTLIKEVEAGKTATRRVDELQVEVAEMNERYQTTLEMLGEKSELVEELRADVQDVKAMYRDLVERTIK